MNGHPRQLAVKLFKLTESQVATPVGRQMNEASTSCVTMRQATQQPKGAQLDCHSLDNQQQQATGAPLSH